MQQVNDKPYVVINSYLWGIASHTKRKFAFAEVAQLAEQGTENPRVGGSIPSLGTTTYKARLGAVEAMKVFKVSIFKCQENLTKLCGLATEQSVKPRSRRNIKKVKSKLGPLYFN